MAGHGSGFSNGLLQLIFNAATVANIADNAATTPLTDLYVSLHIADPGAGGDQTTSECSYTSYARIAVARTSAGWTVSGINVSPAADIVFPTCTGGDEIATHFIIGTDLTGAGHILFFGPLGPTITIANTTIPKIKAASTLTLN